MQLHVSQCVRQLNYSITSVGESLIFDLLFQDASLKVKGLFISAVVPGSPAARCEKLLPGDRILAVNGVSLLGLDCQR